MSIHKPQNMYEHVDYCLRKLGGDNMFGRPVGGIIEIDITPTQCIDRVSEALQRFTNESYLGYTEQVILVNAKKDTMEYEFPPEILSVAKYIPMDDHTSLFALDYQMKQAVGLRFSQFDIVSIELMYEYLKQINIQIGEKIDYDFNPRTHKFILRSMLDKDKTLAVFVTIAVNPDVASDIWDDTWLKRYSFALIKQQWGQNLKKYGGVNLPGGIQINSDTIYEEATEEIQKLEDELYSRWSKPVKFFMG